MDRTWRAIFVRVSYGVAAEGGLVYVVGPTQGSLPGQPFFNNTTAFVRTYDAAGNELWTRQFGSATVARGVAVENDAVYVVGTTFSALPGQTAAGGSDA